MMPEKARRILFAFVLIFLVAGNCARAEDSCAILARDLEQRKRQLADYLEASQKLRQDKDMRLIELLNYKIEDLADQIRTIETEMAGCTTGTTEAGLSEVKSDEGQYATKSCFDLRNMLVQLLRKTSSLKRREKSLFSDLTPAEKNELQEATHDLQIVKSILKGRCAEQEARPAQP
ncbi:MAG TPA: hypothetical protein VK463_20905, partial [Desulfomonilaceae bacterium]|nr:hypothetical protein [Desulfomonilaceae bacterium]